jgi:hypothetical protein
MLDNETIKARLRETREELARVDDQRATLSDLLALYSRLARARGIEPAAITEGAKTVIVRRRGEEIGRVSHPTQSLRATVREVVRSAGEPLRTSEILLRVRAAGADTQGKDPVAIMDLILYSLAKKEPVIKVGPRTWRWTGEPEGKADT